MNMVVWYYRQALAHQMMSSVVPHTTTGRKTDTDTSVLHCTNRKLCGHTSVTSLVPRPENQGRSTDMSGFVLSVTTTE